MSITDKNYNKLSDAVYWLDPNDKKKYDPTLEEGEIRNLGGTKFKVLKVQENSATDGMQAMAVAPLDKNGNVDMSQLNRPQEVRPENLTIGGFFVFKRKYEINLFLISCKKKFIFNFQ